MTKIWLKVVKRLCSEGYTMKKKNSHGPSEWKTSMLFFKLLHFKNKETFKCLIVVAR